MNADDRPPLVVAVLGTATEVGKTWVTARLITALRETGLRVGVRKPVQSYDPAVVEPTDSQVLGAASGEDPSLVCREDRSLPVAMAPPMAAAVLGLQPQTINELVASISWTTPFDVGIVETIGGVRSPIASDGDSVDLARALVPDVTILVSDAELGVLNAVRTSMDAIAPLDPIIHLNRFDATNDLHHRNRDWLGSYDGYTVTTDTEGLASHFLK